MAAPLLAALLADEPSAFSQHPLAFLFTFMAAVAVLLFLVFGGSPAISHAAAHSFASAFGLLILAAAFGALLWWSLPQMASAYADQDTLRHIWAPAVAAGTWVLMLIRLRAAHRPRRWRTPPLREQLQAELRRGPASGGRRQ